MLISKRRSIDDIVVETLAKQPNLEGPALLAVVEKIRPNTTKQALYAALAGLLENETVAKAGSKYFLSQIWLRRIHKLFGKGSVDQAIFDLINDESIQYRFPSLMSCDTYWAHICSLLADKLSSHQALFLWQSHYWFIIGRKTVEKDILDDFKTKNKHAFFSIKGTTSLDMEFKKEFRDDLIAINTGDENNFPDNYHLHIYGDFLIEVFLDKKLAERIDEFYKANTELNKENQAEFEKLISEKYPIRMKISRNKAKAATLCKKLLKDFYIPKEINL